jgi:hypothetical protein
MSGHIKSSAASVPPKYPFATAAGISLHGHVGDRRPRLRASQERLVQAVDRLVKPASDAHSRGVVNSIIGGRQCGFVRFGRFRERRGVVRVMTSNPRPSA